MSFSIAGELDFDTAWYDIGSSVETLMHYVSKGQFLKRL